MTDPSSSSDARSSTPPPIHHDPGQRFWLEQDGEVAYLAYRRLDAATVDYASTWTPPPLRGRGVASRLVEHALAWAREQDLTVIPSCWFVRKVMDRTA
jgi:predicted GNAT family acetyltransferase